ncbi:grasp-with-spasm system SPASM domain peptide maturase [Fulvivirgaceae bacterium BMA12]|uniref:Grasp-with-spasm system SPASM domain peptide maturase n=1 Tax=Agaribacillus aureus TaxID=3051825 RepID=A0ABT8KZZ8_9BACT|nr:grasp-with-spasm system SPASM domain peptide maturase [Fulvivirgaceae bacterium BMA12]
MEINRREPEFLKNYFVLFACCIPVEGANRSTICDLQRDSFELIPNVLYEILTEHEGKSIGELLEAYDHAYDKEILEYLEFLTEKEYGFYSEEPQKFPKMDLTWYNPFPITNAIVDFDEKSDHNLSDIITQLSAMYCPAVELRFFHALPFSQLTACLSLFEDTAIRGVQVMVRYHPDLAPEKLNQLANENPRVQKILIHDAPDGVDDDGGAGDKIIFLHQEITSESCCGQVLPHYFTSNVASFTEAQTFNSCLNRKIGIDKRGEIKNCPSMTKSYGQIKTTSVKAVSEDVNFQRAWHLRKDEISVCKDCEFRYICHDCRAYVTNPADELSKPAKCTYDPYEGVW